MKKILFIIAALAASLHMSAAHAAEHVALIGNQGYDLVSYHQESGPVRGHGNFVVEHEGIPYLFANKANKEAFKASPATYLPAYGGYCAFGVKVGKKFISDPLAWKIVDGTLYLNLDSKVQNIWLKDVPANIEEANSNWKDIATKAPSEL